jgi:glutamate decarboxylase
MADLQACLPQLRAQQAPVRGAEAASFSHGARPETSG